MPVRKGQDRCRCRPGLRRHINRRVRRGTLGHGEMLTADIAGTSGRKASLSRHGRTTFQASRARHGLKGAPPGAMGAKRRFRRIGKAPHWPVRSFPRQHFLHCHCPLPRMNPAANASRDGCPAEDLRQGSRGISSALNRCWPVGFPPADAPSTLRRQLSPFSCGAGSSGVEFSGRTGPVLAF